MSIMIIMIFIMIINLAGGQRDELAAPDRQADQNLLVVALARVEDVLLLYNNIMYNKR